jgi:hypothetical protein
VVFAQVAKKPGKGLFCMFQIEIDVRDVVRAGSDTGRSTAGEEGLGLPVSRFQDMILKKADRKERYFLKRRDTGRRYSKVFNK